MALLSQQAETWYPRCAATATSNGVEVVHGIPGLTNDLVKLEGRWEDYLDSQHILDFATVQKRFLERQPAVVPHLDHIFVDEFQDTNPIQFAIYTGWLASPDTRLTVVGSTNRPCIASGGQTSAALRTSKTRARGMASTSGWHA